LTFSRIIASSGVLLAFIVDRAKKKFSNSTSRKALVDEEDA
jgi:hypothetical protein